MFFFVLCSQVLQISFFFQTDRGRNVKIQRADCAESGATCDKLTAEEAESTNMCKKLGTIRSNQQSCINRVAKETKTAGTLAVVVGGFVACWLPFFILYLATPFIPMEPPNALMPALTWLGNIIRVTCELFFNRVLRQVFDFKSDPR